MSEAPTIDDVAARLIHEPLAHYVSRIERGDHFALLRYGDSEWNTIAVDGWSDRWNSRFRPGLQAALRKTIEGPVDGLVHSSSKRFHRSPERFAECYRWFEASIGRGIAWRWCGTFQDALVAGELGPFIRLLRDRRWALVGPPHTADLDREVFDPERRLEVPAVDAWDSYGAIVSFGAQAIDDGIEVVCLSCGMPATVAAFELWRHSAGRATVIDTGSIFDPWCGVMSRGPYRKMDWPSVRAENLR